MLKLILEKKSIKEKEMFQLTSMLTKLLLPKFNYVDKLKMIWLIQVILWSFEQTEITTIRFWKKVFGEIWVCPPIRWL